MNFPDPGDYLPLVGVLLLAGTTVISIIGAYVIGKSRRPAPPHIQDSGLPDRVARMERTVESMAIEMERVGEGQRFLIKVLGDAQITTRADKPRNAGRIVTPH